MDLKLKELLNFFDKNFLCEKVEVDNYGSLGAHYEGLNLDYYFNNSVLSIDYLSIEDYFDTCANVKYNDYTSLTEQFATKDLCQKLCVIGAVLTLLKLSSCNFDSKECIIKKSITFLKRLGFEVDEKDDKIIISSEVKLFEGSYCDVISYNAVYYKKQLKKVFCASEDWKKRFKYEFENMRSLSWSPYVLKVFNYDAEKDSYLMEICDNNMYEYLEKSYLISDEKIIKIVGQILNGMIDVHGKGIIHRDLHLGNILTKDGNIILSDFGLSKDMMVKHSLTSTSTPKNSHYFMDPVGLTDFTKLDKLSDIYSIGKIIDYITKNSDLNNKLSYLICKATERDRNKRYKGIVEMMDDLQSCLEQLSFEEELKQILNAMKNSVNSPNVYKYILELLKDNKISDCIIKNRLLDFNGLLIQFSETEQIEILSSILNSYSKATGYMRFENYDIFAIIAYNYIRNTKIIKAQKIALEILSGCSIHRFKSKKYYEEIKANFPSLE